MSSKKCNKCGVEKPLTEFYKHTNRKDKRDSVCKLCARARAAARYEAKKEEIIQASVIAQRARRQTPEGKEALKRYNQTAHDRKMAWKKTEKGRASCVYNINKYRAAKLDRTAAWAIESKIKEIYAEASRLSELTGITFHVDHIIPLRGELVSGLHVESNLQILPWYENLAKSNTYEV